MNKRKKKKKIPKNTPYCHGCPWWRKIEIRKLHKNPPDNSFYLCDFRNECKEECWTTPSNSCKKLVCRCQYLKYTDENQDSLLFDKVKECNVD